MNTLTDTAHACHLDSFILAGDFHTRSKELLLSPKFWDVALALEEGATAAALAARLEMPAATIHAALTSLEARGLVSKLLIQCPQFDASENTEAKAPIVAVAELKVDTHASLSDATTIPPLGPLAAPTTKPIDTLPATSADSQPGTLETKPEVISPLATPVATQEHTPVPANETAIKPSEAAAAPLVAMAARSRPETPEESKPEAAKVSAVKFSLKGRSSVGKPAAVNLRIATNVRKTPIQTTTRTETDAKNSAAPATGANAAETHELAASAGEGKGKGWPMQPVLDALRAKTGGDPMIGQLLAYRVFLRVPKELLTQAGIRSVCLIEPDLVIRDPKLKQALETALKEVTGLAWPGAMAKAA